MWFNMHTNVAKKIHMNYHVKVKHINWNYNHTIIKLWNPITKQITKLNL
jgi:hypothetical protein